MKFSTLVLLTATLLSASTKALAHEEYQDSELSNSPDLVQDISEIDTDGSIQAKVEKYLTKKKVINKSFDLFPVEPFLGLPMRYNTIPDQAADQNIALATSYMGQPIVLWGPRAAQQLGPILMGFFMQHEYAHHDLRHNPNNGQTSAMREADADCRAAKTLIQQGRGDIIPMVTQWFAAQGCGYNVNLPIQNVTDSHPCGPQRAQILRQCSGM